MEHPMRFREKLCDIAIAVTILLTGCGGNKQSAEAAKSSAPTQQPKQAPEYAPAEGTFVIKAQKPEIRVYGNQTQYIFHGANPHGFPLLDLSVIVWGAPGTGAPQQISIDAQERAYANLPGATATRKDITQGTYAGRELTLTYAHQSTHMVRLFAVNNRTYILEWNPGVPHSTETADTFEIP